MGDDDEVLWPLQTLPQTGQVYEVCAFCAAGPGTEQYKITQIRDALNSDNACQVCLTNYRKSGEKFYNQLFISPIKDANGRVTLYIGIQTDVTDLIRSVPAYRQRSRAPLEQQLHAAASLKASAQEQFQDGGAQSPASLSPAAAAARLHLGRSDSGLSDTSSDVSTEEVVDLEGVQKVMQVSVHMLVAAALNSCPPCESRHATFCSNACPPGGLVTHSGLRRAPQLEEEEAHDIERRIMDHEQPCSSNCLPTSLLLQLTKVQRAYVMSDPSQPDCPIVYASQQFLELTG